MRTEANKGSLCPGLCPEGELRRGFLVRLEVEPSESSLFSYHDVVSDLEFHFRSLYQEDAVWSQFPDPAGQSPLTEASSGPCGQEVTPCPPQGVPLAGAFQPHWSFSCALYPPLSKWQQTA